MRFGRLRLAAIIAIFAGIGVGVLLGWLTPTFLNPFLSTTMTVFWFFFVTLIVVTPLIGVAEMLWFWERSRFRDDLKELGQSPQIGMGIISPGAIGLGIGLVLGWGLANLN